MNVWVLNSSSYDFTVHDWSNGKIDLTRHVVWMIDVCVVKAGGGRWEVGGERWEVGGGRWEGSRWWEEGDGRQVVGEGR